MLCLLTLSNSPEVKLGVSSLSFSFFDLCNFRDWESNNKLGPQRTSEQGDGACSCEGPCSQLESRFHGTHDIRGDGDMQKMRSAGNPVPEVLPRHALLFSTATPLLLAPGPLEWLSFPAGLSSLLLPCSLQAQVQGYFFI